jgi:peptidyl-tRNA hydrolase
MWTLDILRLTRNDMGFVEGFGTPQMCHAGVKSILQAESGGESGSQLQRRSFHRCMFSEL